MTRESLYDVIIFFLGLAHQRILLFLSSGAVFLIVLNTTWNHCLFEMAYCLSLGIPDKVLSNLHVNCFIYNFPLEKSIGVKLRIFKTAGVPAWIISIKRRILPLDLGFMNFLSFLFSRLSAPLRYNLNFWILQFVKNKCINPFCLGYPEWRDF